MEAPFIALMVLNGSIRESDGVVEGRSMAERRWCGIQSIGSTVVHLGDIILCMVFEGYSFRDLYTAWEYCLQGSSSSRVRVRQWCVPTPPSDVSRHVRLVGMGWQTL